jgi:nucleotide-binding universal stress UspA family protein
MKTLYNYGKEEMTMGLEYKNILVAIDGSKEADWAFKKAVNIAKNNNAKLLLVHVFDERKFTTYEYYDKTLTDREERFAFEMLENYKTDAVNAGVSDVEYLVEYGSPKVMIPKDIANQNNIDLIICGASGLNAVERFFLGSVSANIARYASCDVLIVRNLETS